MAIKTNVPLDFQQPFSSGNAPGANVLNEMKKEINVMKRDLLRKQAALERHEYFNSDKNLQAELRKLKTSELKTPRQIQNKFFELRQKEMSAESSVRGKYAANRARLESLKLGEWGDTLGKVVKTNKDLYVFSMFLNVLENEFSSRNIFYLASLQWFTSNYGKKFTFDTINGSQGVNYLMREFKQYLIDTDQTLSGGKIIKR